MDSSQIKRRSQMYARFAIDEIQNYNDNIKDVALFKEQALCEICGKKFGFLQAQHLCKRCYRVVCGSCQDGTQIVIGYKKDPKNKHKVCNICTKESKFLTFMRQDYKMQWAEDSTIVQEWLKQLGINQTNNELEQSFKKYSYITPETEQSQHYQQMLDLVKDDKLIYNNTRHNYSFLEQIHYISEKKHNNEALNDLKQVLRAFLQKHHKDIGFSIDILDLSIFLLCFASPPKAFAILSSVYTNIVPHISYPISLKHHGFALQPNHVKAFSEILREKFLYDTQSLTSLSKFVEVQGLGCLASMMTNRVNFEVNFHMFDRIMKAKNKYFELVKNFICLVSFNSNSIIKYISSSIEQLQRDILENTNQDEFVKIVSGLQNFSFSVQQNEEVSTSPIKNTQSIIIIEKNSSTVQQDLDEVSQSKKQNASLLDQNQSLKLKITVLEQQIQTQQKTINQLNAKYADLEIEYKSFREKSQESTNSVNIRYEQKMMSQLQYHSEISQLQVKLANSETHVEHLRVQKEEIINFHQKQVAQLKQEFQRIQTEELIKIQQEYQLEKKNFEKHIQNFNQRIKSIEITSIEITKSEISIGKIQQDYQDIYSRYELKSKECQSLQVEITNIKAQFEQERIEYQKKIHNYVKQIDELNTQLEQQRQTFTTKITTLTETSVKEIQSEESLKLISQYQLEISNYKAQITEKDQIILQLTDELRKTKDHYESLLIKIKTEYKIKFEENVRMAEEMIGQLKIKLQNALALLCIALVEIQRKLQMKSKGNSQDLLAKYVILMVEIKRLSETCTYLKVQIGKGKDDLIKCNMEKAEIEEKYIKLQLEIKKFLNIESTSTVTIQTVVQELNEWKSEVDRLRALVSRQREELANYELQMQQQKSKVIGLQKSVVTTSVTTSESKVQSEVTQISEQYEMKISKFKSENQVLSISLEKATDKLKTLELQVQSLSDKLNVSVSENAKYKKMIEEFQNKK